jgi:hypothetical protein
MVSTRRTPGKKPFSFDREVVDVFFEVGHLSMHRRF